MRAALLAALLVPVPAGASSAKVSVTTPDKATFLIEGGFTTKADRATAWAVLTDYEGLPRFVPNMRASRVRERVAGGLLLEQQSVARALLFRRTLRVLLRVREEPPRRIVFEDLSGASFDSYHGSWELREVPEGTEVLYRLEARGGPTAPRFVGRGVSRRLAAALLEAVEDEMLRRSNAKP